jgi:GntR family transcriptional regulator
MSNNAQMLPDSINKQSKLPYYQQLYEILRQKIILGEWKPGDMIPPESELVASYQVSRNTVRQVLDILVNEGYIYRQRGKGTYIAHPTLEQTTSRIISFTEDMLQRGFVPGTNVLEAAIVPAPEDIANQLQIPLGDELVKIKRLRLADGEPMSIEESYLVHRYCPNIIDHNFAEEPLRQILVNNYGIRLVNAKQVIKAIQTSGNLTDELKISKRAALLFLERVSFSQNGLPVEFLRIYYRADRYTLYNELHD